MPNWCHNTLTVSGQGLGEVVEAIRLEPDLIVHYAATKKDGSEVEIFFDTAWTPPWPLIAKLISSRPTTSGWSIPMMF